VERHAHADRSADPTVILHDPPREPTEVGAGLAQLAASQRRSTVREAGSSVVWHDAVTERPGGSAQVRSTQSPTFSIQVRYWVIENGGEPAR
jgi:hypothetical protein